MKDIFLALLTLMFLTVNGISQEDLQNIKNEVTQIKKEHLSNFNEEIQTDGLPVNKANRNLKTGTDDYGNPPNWNWTATYGGSGQDVAQKVAVASDGALYVTGSFSGEISIESNTYSSVGRRDAFLAKFQNDGSFLWFKQFSPLPGEFLAAYDIHLDVSNNIYFTGYYTGDVSFGEFDLAGIHNKNLFLTVANSDGEISMATTHSTNNPEELGLKVDTDSDGNIFVLGSTDGTSSYYHPSVIIKYNPDGSMIFDYYHAQNFSDLHIEGGNIYFSGTILTADYIGDFYLEPMGYNDAFVAKSNTSLEFAWVNMGNHTDIYHGDSRGLSVFVSSVEDVYLLGDYRTQVIWDEIMLEDNAGFVTKFSSEGNTLWAKTIIQNTWDYPTDFTGNDTFIFVSTSFKQPGNPPYLNQIVTKYMTDGLPGPEIYADDKILTIGHSSFDNSLVLTQDTDQQIRLSAMDDVSLNSEWTFLFGGNSAAAYGIGAALDQFGFQYNINYASNQINYFGQTINKGLYLVKQDENGAIKWTVQFADADDFDNFIGTTIVTDTVSNHLYITGTFFNPLIIPDGPTLTPDPSGSVYILKYDFDGNYLWSTQEDFLSSQLCLSADYSDNVLLSGTFMNMISIGNTELVSKGSYDVFIAKYNGVGEVVWAKRAGGEDIEWCGLISTDSQDNVYLTGEFTSVNVTIDNYPFTMEDGDGNILLSKLDAQGNVQWASAKGGSTVTSFADGYGWPSGIHTDKDGYSYIKGWHNDSAHFDNFLLISIVENPENRKRWNKFVAKFDPNGNTIWASTISELNYSMDYNQFDVDKKGNVYTGLRVRDTIYFGDKFMYVNSGRYDLVVAKYSGDGELDWVKSIEDSESGYAWLSSVVCNNEGTAYVSGWFNDYLNFGETSFIANNTNGFIGLLGETTGISLYERNEENLLFDLYPNPARQEVNILLRNELLNNTELTIFDLAGRVAYSQLLSENQDKITLDVSAYSNGIYFIKLQSGNKVSTQKLIVD